MPESKLNRPDWDSIEFSQEKAEEHYQWITQELKDRNISEEQLEFCRGQRNALYWVTGRMEDD